MPPKQVAKPAVKKPAAGVKPTAPKPAPKAAAPAKQGNWLSQTVQGYVSGAGNYVGNSITGVGNGVNGVGKSIGDRYVCPRFVSLQHLLILLSA